MLRIAAPTAWLSLRPPDHWLRTDLPDCRRAAPPGGGLTLEWYPLEPPPPGLPAASLETDDGWPLLLVEGERDLTAHYVFFAHAGRARARGEDAAVWAREQETLRRVLRGARLDLDELVTSIAGFDA